MDIQERYNKEREKREKNGEYIDALPSCLGPCTECDARAEYWSEILGCSIDEVYDIRVFNYLNSNDQKGG